MATVLEFVVMPAPHKLVVVVTRAGVRRRVTYTWRSRTGALPSNWWEAVIGELDWQDAEALAVAQGRRLPF